MEHTNRWPVEYLFKLFVQFGILTIMKTLKTTLMMALCSATLLLSGCATSHSHSTAWDYKVFQAFVTNDIEKQLNQLGS